MQLKILKSHFWAFREVFEIVKPGFQSSNTKKIRVLLPRWDSYLHERTILTHSNRADFESQVGGEEGRPAEGEGPSLPEVSGCEADEGRERGYGLCA